MSRELLNYIMYLVFKSGVMLTTNYQLVHDKAHVEISAILSGQDQQGQSSQVALDEKATVMKLFQANKKEEQDTDKHQEAANQQKQEQAS